jgi:hypothetical protein
MSGKLQNLPDITMFPLLRKLFLHGRKGNMARKKPPKMWVYSPRKPKPPKVPEALKLELETKAKGWLDTEFKPKHLKPAPKNPRFNYVVDYYVKWFRSYFYFCAKYVCPFPDAISPDFETKNMRMEYAGGRNFNLAYMRHTGEWIELRHDLSLDKCLEEIKTSYIHFVM